MNARELAGILFASLGFSLSVVALAERLFEGDVTTTYLLETAGLQSFFAVAAYRAFYHRETLSSLLVGAAGSFLSGPVLAPLTAVVGAVLLADAHRVSSSESSAEQSDDLATSTEVASREAAPELPPAPLLPRTRPYRHAGRSSRRGSRQVLYGTLTGSLPLLDPPEEAWSSYEPPLLWTQADTQLPLNLPTVADVSDDVGPVLPEDLPSGVLSDAALDDAPVLSDAVLDDAPERPPSAPLCDRRQ